MPDTNINTIEKQKQAVEGNESSPDSTIKEMPSPLIETGEESSTPYPETFYQNELIPPTKEAFVNSSPVPLGSGDSTIVSPTEIKVFGYPISTGVEPKTLGDMAASAIAEKSTGESPKY